jgi:hypothetical protein
MDKSIARSASVVAFSFSFAVAVTCMALLSGAVSLSSGLPGSTHQATTAGAAVGAVEAVAYGANDGAHKSPDGKRWCPGYSGVALAYKNGLGSWRSLRIPLPVGQAVQVQDNSPYWAVDLSLVDAGSTVTARVIALAVSDDAWKVTDKGTDGCAITRSDLGTVLDYGGHWNRGCVTTVDIPKDSGAATVRGGDCMGPSGTTTAFYAATVNQVGSNVYAAFTSAITGGIEVYRQMGSGAYAQIVSPFVGKSTSDPPVFARGDAKAISLVMHEIGHDFWFSRFGEVSGTWSTPAFVDSGGSYSTLVTLRNGVSIFQRGFDAHWKTGGPSPQLLFFTTHNLPNGSTRLRGSSCNTVPSFVCSHVAGWVTPSTRTVLLPSLTVVHNPNLTPTIVPYVSYWSDLGSTTGKLTMRFGRLDNGSLVASGGATQVPCPTNSDWGDHDGMYVVNDNAPGATLRRPLTDSTGGACVNGDPQHVSLVSKAP